MVCLWELYWGKVCSISIKVKQLWSAGFSTILWLDFSLLLTLFELLKEAITRDSIFATIRKKVCFSVRLITQKAWYLSTQFPYVETFFSEIAITFYQLMTFWSVCNLTAYWQTSGWQICCCNQKCIFMLFGRVFSSKKGQGSSNLLRHSTIICSFIEQFLQNAQEKSELFLICWSLVVQV